MFRYHYQTKKTKQYTHPKAFYQEYIDTGDELASRASGSDIPTKLESKLHGSVLDMRREFRSTVKRIRKLYSGKEPRISIYETARLARLNLAKSHTST